MSEIIYNRWVLITILSVILIMVVPFLVVWGILNSPPEIALVATIFLVIIWGIVAGYKDWVLSKKETT